MPHRFIPFVLSLFVLNLFLLDSYGALPQPNRTWEKIDDDDGITVYRREVPDSKLLAFKGEALVHAPIAKVATILADDKRRKEWTPRLERARVLRTISFYERIEYAHTRTPWPLVDRDFVFRAKVDIDKNKKKIIINLISEKFDGAPSTELVRGELHKSAFTLTFRAKNETHVEFEIFADPRGSVPKWLVNLVQKNWPRKTLEGLRKQSSKKDIVENQTIKDILFGN